MIPALSDPAEYCGITVTHIQAVRCDRNKINPYPINFLRKLLFLIDLSDLGFLFTAGHTEVALNNTVTPESPGSLMAVPSFSFSLFFAILLRSFLSATKFGRSTTKQVWNRFHNITMGEKLQILFCDEK